MYVSSTTRVRVRVRVFLIHVKSTAYAERRVTDQGRSVIELVPICV